MSRFSMFGIPPVRFGRAPVAPQNRVSASELAAPYQQGVPSDFDHAGHAEANMAAVSQYANGFGHQQSYQPYVPHEEQPVVGQVHQQYYQPTPHAQFLANREAAAQALSDRNIRNYDSMGRPAGYTPPAVRDQISLMVANNLRQQSRNSMTGSQRAFVDNHDRIKANRAMAEPQVPEMTPEQQAFAANWRAANQNRPQYDRVQQAQFNANAERNNLARLRYEQRQRDIRTSRGVALNPNSVASQELLNARDQQKFQNDQQQAAYRDQVDHVRAMRDLYAKRLIEGQPVGADGKPTAIGGANRAQAIHGYNQYSGMARGDIPEGGQEPVHAGQYQDPAVPPQGSMLQRMGQFTEGMLPGAVRLGGGIGGFYGGKAIASRLLGATPWGRAASIALPFVGSVLGEYGSGQLDDATGFSRGVANALPDEASGMLLPAAAAAGIYGYLRGGPKKITPGQPVTPATAGSPAPNPWTSATGSPAPTPSPSPVSPTLVPPASPQPNPWTTATRPAPAPAPAPQNPWTTAMQPGAPRSAPVPQPAPSPAPVPAPAPAPKPVAAPKATAVSGKAPKKSAPPSAVTPNPFAQTPVSQPVSQSLPEVQAVSQPVTSAATKTVGNKIAEKDVEKSILNALNLPEAGKPVGRKRTSAAQTTPTEPVPTPGTPEPVAAPKLQTPEEVLQEPIHGKAPAKRGRTPAKESTAIQPVDAAPVAEVKPKSKTVKPKAKTAAPKEVVPKPETATEPAPAKSKKKVSSSPVEHTPESLDKLWNTTEDLRNNMVTRSQAMVHAKKLYTKGVLDDSDMKSLTRMSKDKDLDGEDLLSEMTLAIEHLQSKIKQSKLKK